MAGDAFFNTAVTARRLGISAGFLNKARMSGEGPPYVKIGKAVRYRWSVVEAWLAERERLTTQD